MSKPLNILMSGGGIAASCFARCLLHAYNDARITIVEKAPSLRLTGASVDVRGPGVDLIKWMNIESEIRQHTTKEEGTSFVRADGSTVATFKATGDEKNQGLTSEYEIFRGALANIFIEPIIDKIDLRFNETVEKYEQIGDRVHVTFSSQKKESYDLLVAADGVGSRIRGQMLNRPPREQIRDQGARVAFFVVHKDLLQGSRIAPWLSLPGGRCIYLRPDPHPEGRTRAHFMTVIPEKDVDKRARFDRAIAAGNKAYMSLMEEEYNGVGWLCPEVLKEMRKSDDFYCSSFCQVRSPKLHDGRVVLLGDAGYATPGIGTSLAMTGAYVLAGELLDNPGDILQATKKYEDLMLPYVHKEQIDFDPMSLLGPQTQLGLGIRDTIFWCMDTFKLFKLVAWATTLLGGKNGGNFVLPKYPWTPMAAT